VSGQGKGQKTMKITMFKKTRSLLIALLTASSTLVSLPETAQAEQLQVSGPLAGAPAVRKLRLYRKLRFEVDPTISFTLLDQYRRQIFLGARLNYGVTDWLSVGAWGGISSSMIGLDLDTDLTKNIQDVNESRGCNANPNDLDCKLTAVNLGDDFRDQLGTMNWIVAPQITAVPFRGKLGLFNEIFVDADLYGFGGIAIIGLDERPDCAVCDGQDTFATESRIALSPTFGLGFTFFTNRWTAVGAEWRALPFKWNTGGFDTKGEADGEEGDFPDGQITSDDREFHFNQMLSISFNMYFPQKHRVSE
jgi:hypothetical protein